MWAWVSGTMTILIEEQLIQPKENGIVRVETPAGLVLVKYTQRRKLLQCGLPISPLIWH